MSIFNLRKHIPVFILVFLSGLLMFSLVDRGGIHLTSYFLAAVSVFPMMILWFFWKKKNVPASHFFLGLFLLFFWLSYFISPMKGEGIRELLIFTSGGLMFLFISQMNFSIRMIRGFFLVLIVFGLTELLYALYVYIFGPFNRLAGTFHDFQYPYAFYPNALANFLLILIPIIGYFFWTAQKRSTEIFSFVGLVFLFAGVFLTYSRGALLVFFVIGLTLFVITMIRRAYTDRRHLLRLFKIGIAIVLSFFIVSQVNFFRSQTFDVNSFREKAALDAEEQNASVNERLDFWKGSLALMKEKPFFGHGPYSFLFVFPKYQKELLAISDHPHNLFLKIGVENGGISLFAFLLFLGATAYSFFRHQTLLSKEQRGVFFVLILSILASLGHNFLDYNFNFTANFLLWWIMLGISMSFISSVMPSKPLRFSREPWFVFHGAVILFSFVFVVFVLHEAYYGYFYKQGRAFFSEKQYEQAIEQYQQANPLWLKRSLWYDMAAAYGEMYEQTRNDAYLQEETRALLLATQEHPYQAFWLYQRAESALNRGNASPQYAISLYLQAIQLDPLNDLGYYRGLLEAFVVADQMDVFYQWVPRVEDLLDIYAGKLRNNEHLTVLTDNPSHAFHLYDILSRNARRSDKRVEYTRKREKLYRYWIKKSSEMEKMYGVTLDLL